MVDTAKSTWVAISQASLTVAKGDTADVNTFAVSYPTAAIFTNKPGVLSEGRVVGTYKSLFRGPIPVTWSGIELAFLLRNATTSADECDAKFRLWGWRTNGHARHLLTVDLVAGTAAVTKHPTTGDILSDFWAYADTIVTITNQVAFSRKTTNGNDEPAELRLDGRGISWLFGDWDCDGCDVANRGSKRAADGICLASHVS